MQNIIRIDPVLHNRINAWARNLKKNNLYPVATIAVGPKQNLQVLFDYERYTQGEIHYILESSLELLEEAFEDEVETISFSVPKNDIH